MKWEKNAPNKVGWWIRLNAIHKPECYWIYEDYRNPDKALCVDWGWAGETNTMRIKDNLHKIEHFWWTPLADLPQRKI